MFRNDWGGGGGTAGGRGSNKIAHIPGPSGPVAARRVGTARSPRKSSRLPMEWYTLVCHRSYADLADLGVEEL